MVLKSNSPSKNTEEKNEESIRLVERLQLELLFSLSSLLLCYHRQIFKD
uniref:Uncharacterized protein n=1 Tax=Rhizophora mucronata TaxID=61149 RepID=A0A2P2NBA2_RHIMU